MAGKRVVIVGGVAGGAACATRLRRLDEQAEIFVYERGGDVSYANCGLPYYLGDVIQNRQQLLVATPERFRDWYNIEVRARHEVRTIDRVAQTVEVANVLTGTTATVPYDALVLSTGATPIRPPLPGLDFPGVFTVRSLEDMDRIRAWDAERKPARAVVVGGGFVGLEMTENLVRRGLEVTLMERLGQVMPNMDPEMVTPVQQELRRQGVDLRLSTPLSAIERSTDEELIVVGRVGQRFATDMVVLAMGVRPDVNLARHAGLEIGALGGIRVDEQMRTSDPAIYAVGDAVEIRDYLTGQPTLMPLAGPAARQGRVAADAIAGRLSRFRGSQATAIVGVFDVTLGITGTSESRLRQAGTPYGKIYTHSLHHAGYFPGAEMMALKLLFTPDDGRLLGAQAVGRAGIDKRIDVLSMAIQKGATLGDLEEAELCYAPQYGSAKDPVNIAGFAGANILRGDVEAVFWSDWLVAQQRAPAASPLVVDVRTRAEAAAGAVPGSVNIPLGELRTRLNELPREREIWVHCGVGQRSYYACRVLKQRGFCVKNLAGGMRSYQMQPVVEGEPSARHVS
jgi:NADPH-dependent 2,4-dienoyl-CoA reductase/sulfur reductase-like enzyme/rhodanese-related sulfurtransferase